MAKVFNWYQELERLHKAPRPSGIEAYKQGLELARHSLEDPVYVEMIARRIKEAFYGTLQKLPESPTPRIPI
jgi:hypothetical protein